MSYKRCLTILLLILITLSQGGWKMVWVIIFALITIGSVILALNKKKPVFLVVPFISVFLFMLVKIIMVPMPFWETIRFIFNLRG